MKIFGGLGEGFEVFAVELLMSTNVPSKIPDSFYLFANVVNNFWR